MRRYTDNLHLSLCASCAVGYCFCCYIGCFHSWLRRSMLFGKCVINLTCTYNFGQNIIQEIRSSSNPSLSSPSIFFQNIGRISSKIKRAN